MTKAARAERGPESIPALTLFAQPAEEKAESLKAWALVELFGHQRIVGWVTVDPPDFPGMVRVDVPDLLHDGKVKRKGMTRFFGRGALYAVTPVDEKTVRALLPSISGEPARQYSIGGEDY